MVTTYTCPVCGYPDLENPARSPTTGGGSFEICLSCGFQFGVTDDDRGYTYDAWRKKWVGEGMRWYDSDLHPPPSGWDPAAQLRRVTET